MQSREIEEVAKKLRGLFPKTSDEDAELLLRHLEPFTAADCVEAIEKHRWEQGKMAYRVDPRRVVELAGAQRADRNRAKPRVRTIDVIRSQNHRQYAGMDSYAMVYAHYSECWAQVRESPAAEIGQQMMRAYILAAAQHCFGEIGMNRADALDQAREVVDLKPGQQIKDELFLKTMEPVKCAS